jgi:uncharacterized protein
MIIGMRHPVRLPLMRDPLVLLSLTGGPVFWLLLSLLGQAEPLPPDQLWSFPFFSVSVVQPVLEEVLFRGLIQGLCLQSAWGAQRTAGLSYANLLTSSLFALAHLAAHPVGWAMAVIAPSLLFGWWRERSRSVVPPILLHSFYNVGYFLVTGGRTLAGGM